MSTGSKILVGILGAAAAGVIVGMLIAPEKGKDTRKKIKSLASDWADNLAGLWAKSKKATEDAFDEVGETDKNLEKALNKR
ncbi:MAG: YtxH domain-containing protein [Chitinophagaceae bacterium]